MEKCTREDLLFGLISSIARIIEHCRENNESFGDFVVITSENLADCEDYDSNMNEKWKPCESAIQTRINDGKSHLIAENLIYLFKNKNGLRLKADKFCYDNGIGAYKLDAVIYNLECYGLIEVIKSKFHPFSLSLTKLGRKIKDESLENHLHDCLMLPYPTEAKRREFWAQRGISVES